MKKVLFILIAIAAVACEKDVRLASIEIIPVTEVYVGDQTKLQIQHAPAEAIAPTLYYYKTSDAKIATVNDNGVVICHQPGTCTITASTADKRFTSKCMIQVKDKAIDY